MDVVEERVQPLQIRSARFVQPHETLFHLVWPEMPVYRDSSGPGPGFHGRGGRRHDLNEFVCQKAVNLVYQREEVSTYRFKWNSLLGSCVGTGASLVSF